MPYHCATGTALEEFQSCFDSSATSAADAIISDVMHKRTNCLRFSFLLELFLEAIFFISAILKIESGKKLFDRVSTIL